MARIILLEGLDGTGKTTMAKMLSDLGIPQIINDHNYVGVSGLTQAKIDFYQQIRELPQDVTYCLDRHILTDICYDSARGLDVEWAYEEWERFLDENEVIPAVFLRDYTEDGLDGHSREFLNSVALFYMFHVLMYDLKAYYYFWETEAIVPLTIGEDYCINYKLRSI